MDQTSAEWDVLRETGLVGSYSAFAVAGAKHASFALPTVSLRTYHPALVATREFHLPRHVRSSGDRSVLAEKNKAARKSALTAGNHPDYTIAVLSRADHMQWEACTGSNAEMPSLRGFVPARRSRTRVVGTATARLSVRHFSHVEQHCRGAVQPFSSFVERFSSLAHVPTMSGNV